MSIWCSWRTIGYDGMVTPDGYGVGIASTPEHGEVRSYATGFSNHYPTIGDRYEQPANVAIATIPVWCVPGHREETGDEVAPWVRLDVWTAEHDYSSGGVPTGKYDLASVVMDEAAARALAADLLAWADADKARPVATSADLDASSGHES